MFPPYKVKYALLRIAVPYFWIRAWGVNLMTKVQLPVSRPPMSVLGKSTNTLGKSAHCKLINRKHTSNNFLATYFLKRLARFQNYRGSIE